MILHKKYCECKCGNTFEVPAGSGRKYFNQQCKKKVSNERVRLERLGRVLVPSKIYSDKETHTIHPILERVIYGR